MNKLSLQKRAQILALLVEGTSMRAITRLVGCSINTVTKLLIDAGTACLEYQDQAMRDLPCKRIQCDEIWAFCGMKDANVPAEHKGELGYGDVWTWTSICADTKIVPSFLVGKRDAEHACAFASDLASRIKGRAQISTDGLRLYVDAVEDAFGSDVNFAQLIKIYGNGAEGKEGPRRYSPPVVTGTKKLRVSGDPDAAHVSTSFVERQNLTMRMGMRRFTRLTNGFSKKIENLEHSVALHFMHYNFVRIHKTLRVTPAMEAGVSDHVWTIEEIAALVPEPVATKRGPYKKN